jgi:hypothetical protein
MNVRPHAGRIDRIGDDGKMPERGERVAAAERWPGQQSVGEPRRLGWVVAIHNNAVSMNWGIIGNLDETISLPPGARFYHADRRNSSFRKLPPDKLLAGR